MRKEENEVLWRRTRQVCAALLACLVCGGAQARIALIAPHDKAVVAALPAAQRAVLAKATQEARRTAAALETGPWRANARLLLSWRATGVAAGPWKVRIGTDPDLISGEDWWIPRKEITADFNRVYHYEVPRPNLMPGRRYWWRVWGNIKCTEWLCGSTIGPNGCACGKSGPAPASEVWSFVVEDEAPRWIELEGRIQNIRDLGGWRTADGRRVRRGLVFRGEGLNDNSLNGEAAGRNRLTVEDVDYLTRKLGIKTDLDLRTARETASMTVSPLGASISYINHSSRAYMGIFTPEGMKMMAENIRLFCDRSRYPIYFHCIGGADRTGSLAYVLNGLLGVEREDLERDWESTFYPDVPNVVEINPDKKFGDDTYWRSTSHFDKGFAQYARPGDTLQDRIVAYLAACGVTPAEMEAVRANLLEEETVPRH